MNHGYWILRPACLSVSQATTPPGIAPGAQDYPALVGIAIGLPILWFCALSRRATIVPPGDHWCAVFLPFAASVCSPPCFIALLVLLCFNLLGEGFGVALPRDHRYANWQCYRAGLLSSFIWPDSVFVLLPRVVNGRLTLAAATLSAILEQYHPGP